MEYSGLDNLEVMRLAHNYNRFLRKSVQKAAGRSPRVLDFGAGIGEFSEHLKKAGMTVETVETDSNLSLQLNEKGFVVHSDLSKIPNDQFDFIFSLNVLEHIEDDHKVVQQLARVLKPGGRLYLYVPAFQMLWTSMDDHVGHYRRYNKRSMEILMENCQFQIQDLGYCDSMGFMATVAYKILGDSKGTLNPRALQIFDRFLFPLNRVLDLGFKRILGKNVYCLAQKPLSLSTKEP